MKTKQIQLRDEVAREWAASDPATELEARTFARTWMERVRVKDIVADLKCLEKHSRHRAHYFEACQLGHVFTAAELAGIFQKLEKDQRSLTEKFRRMHEQLGLNLLP
ncbi:MAG: hypothetical protein WCS42_13525 [Verrucomicrobiota bacterium]